MTFKGKHHSEETKAKMRERFLGKNNPMFGKHLSEETKAKIKNKLREMNLGSNNPMFGKHLSEGTKAKLSVALSGNRNPNYGKFGAKNHLFGTHRSEETKLKIGMANKGERNGMWRGENATACAGRNRAKRLYGHPKGKEIHHVDGNPLNNDERNIAIVTRKQHMEMDGRLFRKDAQGKFR